jgi:RHS repeat-associated protein
MCPGIAVLGGGGDGGDGDGSGNGGKDGAGGDGSGNGENGSGDGKGGAGCGAGGDGPTCSVHDAAGAAGHPVDVVTGRAFTDVVVDLFLPGPLPFKWSRAYSAAVADVDAGLGHGWSHSFRWEITIERRFVRVFTADGRRVDFDVPREGDSVLGPDGWVLRRETWGYLLDMGDDVWLVFSHIVDDGKRYLLTSIQDANSNRINIEYDDGRLSGAVDSAGRHIRFRSTPEGRVAAVQVLNAISQGQWLTFAEYLYDDQGDLVSVRDAEGATTRFAYTDHLITAEEGPTGLTYHFVYDQKRRCVETWGDYPGRADPALAAGLPALLADNKTRAKGIFHVKLDFDGQGYSEVADSVRVQRFFGNKFGTIDKAVNAGGVTTRVFDERGHMIEHTDPEGATAKWERDRRGRTLKLTNAMGLVTSYERDDLGHIVKITDPAGGVTTIARDRNGNRESITNPMGSTWTYRRDHRGLIVEEIAPDGSHERCTYDAQGNLVEWTMGNGGVWRWTYDHLGRVTSRTDPVGASTRYVHSARGELVAAYDPNGGVRRYAYDGEGNHTEQIDADGRVWKYEYGGNNALCAMEYPNGDVARVKYNRECVVVEAHNERGEVFSLEYNQNWNIVREKGFDGRVSTYRYDRMGRMLESRDALNEVIEYVYNPLGELVEIHYEDGTVHSFERNANGLLVGAKGPKGEVRFERDAVGGILRQALTIGGETYTIDSAFDVTGARAHRRTSLGHVEELTHDGLGNPERIRLDQAFDVAFERNPLGQETCRALPGGGRIESSFNPMGWLSRRRVVSPSAHVAVGGGQPDWVGADPRGTTADRAYQYSLAGEITQRWDANRGVTSYEYDPRGRLLAALPERAREELFSYDPTSNVHERGPGAEPRVYGPANQLLERGNTRFQWDGEGRLVEKRTPRPDGEGEDVWKYGWNPQGNLARVERPDGVLVEFSYDPMGRRIEKRATTPGPVPGAPRVVQSATRFIWDRSVLVHEIRERAAGADDPIIEERTYCFNERTVVPHAHQDARFENGERVKGPWFHYVNDVLGTPEQLVGEDGSVACELRRSAWGLTEVVPGGQTTTPLRFQGQYEDEETGLVYNRARYYDPALGRFINPDPIGPAGGFNEFNYCVNPITWVDPFGLDPHNATVSYDGGPPQKLDSTWPDSWKEKVPGAPKGGQAPADYKDGVGAGKKRQACHTEHKACDNAPPGTKTIAIHGERPPCTTCRGRMQKYMDDNPGTKVTYTWDAGKDPEKAGSKSKYYDQKKKDGSWPAGSWP